MGRPDCSGRPRLVVADLGLEAEAGAQAEAGGVTDVGPGAEQRTAIVAAADTGFDACPGTLSNLKGTGCHLKH